MSPILKNNYFSENPAFTKIMEEGVKLSKFSKFFFYKNKLWSLENCLPDGDFYESSAFFIIHKRNCKYDRTMNKFIKKYGKDKNLWAEKYYHDKKTIKRFKHIDLLINTEMNNLKQEIKDIYNNYNRFDIMDLGEE